MHHTPTQSCQIHVSQGQNRQLATIEKLPGASLAETGRQKLKYKIMYVSFSVDQTARQTQSNRENPAAAFLEKGWSRPLGSLCRIRIESTVRIIPGFRSEAARAAIGEQSKQFPR